MSTNSMPLIPTANERHIRRVALALAVLAGTVLIPTTSEAVETQPAQAVANELLCDEWDTLISVRDSTCADMNTADADQTDKHAIGDRPHAPDTAGVGDGRGVERSGL